MFNLIIENTEKYLSIKAKEEVQGKNGPYDDIKGYYVPSYISEGFALESEEQFGDMIVLSYINELKDHYIRYHQSSNNSNLQLDSENAIIEDIKIRGMNGIVISKEDFIILFWYNEELNFYIISDIKLEELIKVAESLEIKR